MKKNVFALILSFALAAASLTSCGDADDEMSDFKPVETVSAVSSSVPDTSSEKDSSQEDLSSADESSEAEVSAVPSETDGSKTEKETSPVTTQAPAKVTTEETTKATTKATTQATTKATTAATTKATTKATTQPTAKATPKVTQNTSAGAKEFHYSGGPSTLMNCISIQPVNIYEENGELVLEAYVSNGYNHAVYNIRNTYIELSDKNKNLFAKGSFGTMVTNSGNSLVINANSYVKWTFTFGSDCFDLSNADLSAVSHHFECDNSY